MAQRVVFSRKRTPQSCAKKEKHARTRLHLPPVVGPAAPREYPQRIQSEDVQINREAVPEAGRTKTLHTSEDRQNQVTIPTPKFATKPLTTSSAIPVELPQNYKTQGRQTKSRHNSNAEIATKPLTASSTIPVDIPQNYMVGQQRQQISEKQFDKFPHPHHFWCGKYDSKLK